MQLPPQICDCVSVIGAPSSSAMVTRAGWMQRHLCRMSRRGLRSSFSGPDGSAFRLFRFFSQTLAVGGVAGCGRICCIRVVQM